MRMTMRCSAFISVLVLALTIGRSGATATSAVQDSDVATPFVFGELEGAQVVVSRTYTVDFDAMLDGIGTPGADGQPAGIPKLSGVISLAGVIGQFDSSDHAAAAVDRIDVLQLNEESTASIENEPDAPTLREVEIDLGQTSRAYAATQEIEGQTLNLSVIIVQQDEFLYYVVGGVIDADAQSLATAFTEALIVNEADAGEPQFKGMGRLPVVSGPSSRRPRMSWWRTWWPSTRNCIRTWRPPRSPDPAWERATTAFGRCAWRVTSWAPRGCAP